MLIPKNTSVLIHQVPGRPRVRLITTQEYVFTDLLIPSALFSYLAILLPRIENKVEHVQAETSNSHVALPPAAKYIEYEFGNDFYFIPAASIDTPALDWQRHLSTLLFLLDLIGNVKIILGQGEVTYKVRIKTPPPGYICHRCNVAGHCIHHCPTNGDSNYNVKRVKPPTGIPKSMLVALIHCQVVQLQLLNQKRKLWMLLTRK
ncbi:BnaAnng20140D [Brassica napus]|uniref:BnaAnng20140D protein n=1 Tax=Brassica napus TaxID=3708 RepID=A0A078JHC4_BRANA|nr:BnaAnng20140D [Brassica napus]